MSRNGRAIVAMSGGVDSSVAAVLLKEQGYDCVGVFMRVGASAADEQPICDASGGSSAPPRRLRHGCCSATDAIDARAIAGRLGIPFYALNFQPDFERIIGYFVDEYARARTPNPCVQCNIQLKFGKLLRYADMMDAALVATGHYARIVQHDGRARLARAANLPKDQSYVLFGIRREDLPRCRFPLGDMPDKSSVRRIAAELGLRVHDKPDSQEICFVPKQDYRALLRERRPELLREGELHDEQGRVLGRHEGVSGFTIGQRRGLGVALGAPAYVTHLDVVRNVVTLGPKQSLYSDSLRIGQLNWLADPPPTGAPRSAQVKIRHMHEPGAARVTLDPDGGVTVRFEEPQLAITPGQAAVIYEDELVLGGGWIESDAARVGGESPSRLS